MICHALHCDVDLLQCCCNYESITYIYFLLLHDVVLIAFSSAKKYCTYTLCELNASKSRGKVKADDISYNFTKR